MSTTELSDEQGTATADTRNAVDTGANVVNLRAQMSPTASAIQGVLYASIVVGLLYALTTFQGISFDAPFRALAALAGLMAFGLFRRINITAHWRIGRRGSPGTRMLLNWLVVVAALLAIAYLTQYSAYFARSVTVSWFLLTPLTLTAVNLLFRWIYIRALPDSASARSAVMVFAGDAARSFSTRLRESREYQVHGYFDDRDAQRVGGIGDLPLLGRTRELAPYVRRHRIDVVFVVLPVGGSHRAVGLFEELGDTTASVYFVPDFDVFDQFETRLHSIASTPVLEIVESPIHGVDGLIKHLFDLMFASAALLALSPLLLVIALWVKLDSPGPVLFRQKRYGLNGREFWVYKFRSMVVGDVKLADSQQATRGDPRITRSGRFIRRTSIDELPQFFNVLKGEMSVVGPRPHTVAHNEFYRGQVRRYMSRHKVKPGVTGLAQVSGLRGETAQIERMEERIKFDLEYIRSWSLWLDIQIIFRTVVMVLRHDDNAY